ncbi:O-antigen ligase RfaL [Providencia manganoxydans]|uniref:O-antigen ligase RfaL n=1 Tax=Providencia manganoxydans TaxID=2923283 RepID=UPI0032DAEF51
MILTKRLSANLAFYNRALVFLFVTLFFVENVTKYKHAVFYLMILTVIYYLIKDTKNVLQALNNKLFYFTLFFSIVTYISIGVSLNPESSLKSINNNFLNYGVLSLSILFPIVLYKESKTSVATLLILSFSSALIVMLLVELGSYYVAYEKGIMPFSNYDFRSVSDSLVFYFPVLLSLWYFLPKPKFIYFYLLAFIFLFVLLGTLSRGAWVAVAVSAMLFLLFKRPWKLIIVTISLILIGLVALKLTMPDMTKKLFFKLEQTDSSYRYKNGTQGSAFELIMQKPIVGYGFGDKVYIEKYNSVVEQYPEWTFRQSIGPHNIWLSTWFSSGILGLLSFSLLFISICYYSYRETRMNNNYKQIYFSGITIFISIIGFYFIRGMFEQVNLKPLGILIGFLIALMNSNLDVKNKGIRYE